MKVDYGELGILEFPDTWTESQVRDFVIANEGQIRKSMSIRARQPAMRELAESETQLEATPDRANPIDVMGRGAAGQVGSVGSLLQAASAIERQFPLIAPLATGMERLGVGDFLRSFRQDSNPRQVPTLADIGQAYEERGLLDAAREAGAFAAGGFLEQVPNVMASVGTAGALGLAQVPARAAAVAAPFITTFPVEAGGAFEEIRDRAPDSNEALAALAAMGVGGVNAALETVSEAPIIAKAIGLDSLLSKRLSAVAKSEAAKRIASTLEKPAARFATSVLGESLTETGQELATGTAPELFGAERDPNLGMRLLESGVAGGMVSVPFSGAAEFQRSRNLGRQNDALLQEALAPVPPPITEDRTMLAAQARSAQVRQAAGLADAQSAEAFAMQAAQIDSAKAQALQEGADPLLVNVKAAVGKLNIAAQRKAQATAIETGLATAEQEIATAVSGEILQQGRERIVQEAAGARPQTAQSNTQAGQYGVMDGRVFIPALVNGVPMLFYKSSKGTSGKTAGKWYPAFGAGAGDWIIKGRVQDMERGYGIPEVAAAMEDLNQRFPGSYEDTVSELKASAGEPVGFRQIAAATYGPAGSNRMIGVNNEGMIDNSTGVNQRIREVLNAVVKARPPQPSPVQAGRGLAILEEQQATREAQFPAAPRPIQEEPAPTLESILGPNVLEQLRAARQRDLEAQAAANPPPQAPAPQPPAPPAVDVEAERIADELNKLEDEDVLAAALRLPEEMAARVGKVVRERTNKGIRELNARREARAGTPEANPYRPNITAPPRTQPAAPVPPTQPPSPGPVTPPEPAAPVPPSAPPVIEEKPKGRKKVGSEGFAKKRTAGTIDEYVSDVDNLTPEEIAQVEYDRGFRQTEDDRAAAEARAKEIEDEDPDAADEIRETVAAAPRKAPVAKETNKTRYIKFRDQLQRIIRNHPSIGILRGDPSAEQRVEDAVLRDAKRTFADAQKNGKNWELNFAVASAKRVIPREILNITKTAEWKEKAKTMSLTQEGESGTSQRDIPVNSQEEEEADPELEQVEDERAQSATRTAAAIQSDRLRVGKALSEFIQDKEIEDEEDHRAIMMRYLDRTAGRSEAMATFSRFKGTPAYDAAFNLKSKDYKRIDALFEEFYSKLEGISKSLAGQIKVAITPDQVTEAIVRAFGRVPPSLTVINDPNHVLPDGSSGVGVAGYMILRTGQVVINAAYIESQRKAVEVALEEYVHLIWGDPSIQEDFDRVKAEVTEAEIQSMVAAGYAREVAVEEAAIRKVIAYLDQNLTQEGSIQTLLSNVWNFLKELIGFGSEFDQSRNAILRRAVEAMSQEPAAVTAQQDAAYMAAVGRGDMATAQRMVGDAAIAAGYTTGPVWHGSRSKFNKFSNRRKGSRTGSGDSYDGFFFAPSRSQASIFAEDWTGYDSGFGTTRPFYIRNEEIRTKPGIPEIGEPDWVEYVIQNPEDAKLAEPITRDNSGDVIPLSRRFDSRNPDIRRSITSGLFFNQEDLSTTVAEAKARGSLSIQTLADIGQIQGELIPRTTLSQIEAMAASGDRVDNYAATALSPILKFGQLSEPGFIGALGPSNLSARIAWDLPADTSQELAARAVVRTHLTIEQKKAALAARLERAKKDLEAAVADLPRAAEAMADAEVDKHEGEDFLRKLDQFLANQLAMARSKDVIDATELQAIQSAASKASEARKSITAAIGSALRAFAREMPPQITSEAAMSTWIWDRHLDKSLPPLMSDRVADFLTNPMDGKRNPPIMAISIADTINQLRAISQARAQTEAEIKAFRAAYGKRMNFKQAAIEYVGLREKYRNALNLARKINRKVDVTAVRVAGLEKAMEELNKMISSTSYQTKLRAGIEISGTMDSAIKLTVGTRGQTSVTMDGTMSVVDPMTDTQVIIPLTPSLEQVQDATAKIERLINSMKTFIAQAEMGEKDPIKAERVKRDLARLMAMASPAKPLVATLIPTWVPIIGDMEIPSVWTLVTRMPWFGKRLAAPNNIMAWVGGFAGQSLASLVQARDYVVKRLDGLRADPDPKAPSQRAVDIATVVAMKAHGLDPRNPAHQEIIQRHSSRILSQHQTPGAKKYELGQYNAIDELEVLKEDIALADAQKRLEDAIQAIVKKLPKNVLALPLFRQGLGVEETFAGRSISRSSPNYGYKMSRRADRVAVPVLDEWAKSDASKKVRLMQTYYKTLVLGIALETDPTMALRMDKLDREAFNELISMERRNEIPFTDFDGFIAWLAQYRAAETELTEAEEVDLAVSRISGYIDRLSSEFGVEAAENAKGVDDVALLDAKRNLPPPIVQAMTADNQFVRPRVSLKGPSTWYTYDLVGSTSQEVYKAGLVNLMSAIELSGWMNLRKALAQSLVQWDEKLQKLLASGVSHRNAIRQLNRESRARSNAIPSEADYATVRDLIQFVDAAVAELQRSSQEYIATPADTGFARTGSQLLQAVGSQLLASGGSMVNNTVGQDLMAAMITGWLGRLSMAAAGVEFAGSMVKQISGSVLAKAAQKIPWFNSWLKTNGPVVDALNKLIGSTMAKRTRAISALTLDVPDVKSQVAMITSIPGTYGVIDPRRETGSVEWLLNMIQSGFLPAAVTKLPAGAPPALRKGVEIISSAPSYFFEQFKRIFPGTLDRIGNAVAAPIFNATFNEIGFKKRAFDIMARREAEVPGWNQPGNPNFNVADEEWEGVMDPTGIKLIRDAIAPYGSFEQVMLDYYQRTKDPANVATTPFLSEDFEDAIAFEFLKLTNLRTESTTPQVSKGKGLMGFWRKTLSQFGRYGQNMVGVMERRFAKVAGNSDDENKLFAGFALAFMFLVAAILGMEVKGLWRDYIDDEPRTAPTLNAASEDPGIAARYVAASLASQIPYLGEQLQKMAGGTQPSSPFDLANSVPLLGTGTRAYQALTRFKETGDPVYPMVDMLRSTIPMSKPLLNRVMPGDTLRREAQRAVRSAAPSNLEIRQFGGGGRGSPFQPIIRSTINAYLEGDMQGYNAGYQRAIQYQMGLGKDRKEAERTVVSALASRDPLTSTVGRNVTEQDEATILRRLTPRQKNAFLRARSLTASLSKGRTNPLRKRRNQSRRRTRRKPQM